MKFHARVCRPRFEFVVVDMETNDEDEAEVLALGQASRMTDWHLRPYDDESYTAHIDRIVRENEVGDAPEDYGASVEEMRATLDDAGGIKYVLLQGDIETGEGQVIFEPWFDFVDPQLLERDIAGDWISALQNAFEEGEENYKQTLTDIVDGLPDTQKPIIVPAKRPTASASQEDLADPSQYHTEIPELLASPLTRTEHEDVLNVLARTDEILANPLSVGMLLELAAVMLARATKAAYASAAATGQPSQAQPLHDLIEELAVRRSREVNRQDRRA